MVELSRQAGVTYSSFRGSRRPADIDPVDSTVRVAAKLSSHELLALLTRAGYPVDWNQLEQVPSVCCGACGG